MVSGRIYQLLRPRTFETRIPEITASNVDLIYLNPPFNSDRDYAAPVGSRTAGATFKDTCLSDLDVAWMGLVAGERPAIQKTLDAAGSTHGKAMQSYSA